jgi:hypothetical protein
VSIAWGKNDNQALPELRRTNQAARTSGLVKTGPPDPPFVLDVDAFVSGLVAVATNDFNFQ